jgi:hypothetical protein
MWVGFTTTTLARLSPANPTPSIIWRCTFFLSERITGSPSCSLRSRCTSCLVMRMRFMCRCFCRKRSPNPQSRAATENAAKVRTNIETAAPASCSSPTVREVSSSASFGATKIRPTTTSVRSFPIISNRSSRRCRLNRRERPLTGFNRENCSLNLKRSPACRVRTTKQPKAATTPIGKANILRGSRTVIQSLTDPAVKQCSANPDKSRASPPSNKKIAVPPKTMPTAPASSRDMATSPFFRARASFRLLGGSVLCSLSSFMPRHVSKTGAKHLNPS